MLDISKLRAVRKTLNLTQHQLAKEAGVSQSLIAKIEAGRIDPTYSRVQRIEDAIQRLRRESERTAKDVMSRNVIVARPDERADLTVRRMREKNISQLPVVDGNAVIGLVSETSILDAAQRRPLNGLSAKDIMSTAPPQVADDAPLSAVRALLAYFPCAIVMRDGRMSGIITKSDLLAQLS